MGLAAFLTALVESLSNPLQSRAGRVVTGAAVDKVGQIAQSAIMQALTTPMAQVVNQAARSGIPSTMDILSLYYRGIIGRPVAASYLWLQNIPLTENEKGTFTDRENLWNKVIENN